MKAFWKDNSYIIVKLILNQVAMMVFALMVQSAFLANVTLKVVASVFSVLFYLFLVATVVYEVGAQDFIRIEAGRMKPQPYRGLWIGLCSGAVNIILGIIIYVSFLFEAPGNTAAGVNAVCVVIANFWQAMYLGLINTFMPENNLSYILITLPALFVCTLVYYLAQKGAISFNLGTKKE